MKNFKKIILSFGVIIFLLTSFPALNVFAQLELSEITIRFREVETSFNNLTKFIEQNPRADSEILDKLSDYLAAKKPFDQYISNLSVADSDRALKFVADLIEGNSSQINKIQELRNGGILSEKISSILSKISDGLLAQNSALNQWIKDQQIRSEDLVPERSRRTTAQNIISERANRPQTSLRGLSRLKSREDAAISFLDDWAVEKIQKSNPQEKTATLLDKIQNFLSGIFKKKEGLPAIEKAWIEESKPLTLLNRLIFHIKFQEDFSILSLEKNIFAGFLIDKDNNPKTGQSFEGPTSKMGADLFIGIFSDKNEAKSTQEIKDLKIDGDTLTFITDVFAEEFSWIAVASRTDVAYTRAPEKSFKHYKISEIFWRDAY